MKTPFDESLYCLTSSFAKSWRWKLTIKLCSIGKAPNGSTTTLLSNSLTMPSLSLEDWKRWGQISAGARLSNYWSCQNNMVAPSFIVEIKFFRKAGKTLKMPFQKTDLLLHCLWQLPEWPPTKVIFLKNIFPTPTTAWNNLPPPFAEQGIIESFQI